MRDKNSKIGLLKYKLKKSKWNVLIIFNITFLALIIIIGLYLFICSQNVNINNFKDKDLSKIKAASQVMFYQDDGSFDLVQLSSKKTIDTYKIKGFSNHFIVKRTTDFSGFVVYDPIDKSIYNINVKKRKIQKNILLRFNNKVNVTSVACSGYSNYFAYASDNKNVNIYNNKNKISSEKFIDVKKLFIDNDTLAIITKTGLFLNSFNIDSSNKLLLSSNIENIQFLKDKLYVFDEFGINNKFSLIFEINKNDLLVKHTYKVDGSDLSVPLSNSLSSKIYFSSDDTFETLTSGTSNKDFKTITLPTTLSSNAIYNQDVLYTSKSNFYLIVKGKPYYGIDKTCSDFALIYDDNYYKLLEKNISSNNSR